MARQVLEDTLTADSIAADTALAASGDATAFERLYRTHVARVHTLVRRMLDADEADDVTQDVFIRAWQKLSTFRGESAFGTWLHRLAVNVVLARRRTVGIERGRSEEHTSELQSPCNLVCRLLLEKKKKYKKHKIVEC